MTKVEIIALAEKWEAAAQRAEARYQDSGAARHLREKEQAEDLSAALWMAADAADDHEALIGLRSSLNGLAAKAHAAIDANSRNCSREVLVDLARNVISTARLYGVDSVLAPSKRRQPKGEITDG